VYDVIKFSAATLVFFYVPGRVILNLLKKGVTGGEGFALSVSIGLAVVPILYYYLETLKLHQLFLFLTFLASLLYLVRSAILFLSRKKFTKKRFALSREGMIVAGIVLVVLIISAFVIGTSGLIYRGEMRFYRANAYDSIAQLSMIEELSKKTPHQFPFASGLPFKGYYTGAFYWRAIIQKVTDIDSIDLFFRYCPAFLFTLIVFASFFSLKKILNDTNKALLSLFFVFLMSEISWVFPVADRMLPGININTVHYDSSILKWIIFNPPFAQGILIFFLLCYFLKICRSDSGSDIKWPAILFTGFLLGSLFEYKAFLWATIFPAVIMAGFADYALNKRKEYLLAGAIATVFFVLSFVRVGPNQSAVIFRYYPGFYALGALKEAGIIAPNSIIKWPLILSAILIFIPGILGVKIVGFYEIYRNMKKPSKMDPVYMFLICGALISFAATSVCILDSKYSHATYNFISTFIIVMSILSGSVIIRWLGNVRPHVKRAAFLTLALMSGLSMAFSFLAYFPVYSIYKAVPEERARALRYIKNKSEEDAVVLYDMHPTGWVSLKKNEIISKGEPDRDSFVSALTARRVVVECGWHMSICGYEEEFRKRRLDVETFFSTSEQKKASEILRKYHVDYVLVDPKRQLKFKKKKIMDEIFKNEKATVYRVVL